MRRCATCREVKPDDQFSANPSYCRPCWNARQADYRRRNPARINASRLRYLASRSDEQRAEDQRRWRSNQIKFTAEQWQEMFSSQGHRCAICRTDTPGGKGWHVDHDHKCCPGDKRRCGKCNRAILCSRCNVGIGMLQDDPGIIREAADYVERWRKGMNT